jgi:preprotein translocase subunit SecG
MQTLITVIHITTCIFLVGLVLIQSGKGAEISASFAGSSQTIFGSSGGANFFTRATGTLAAIFFVTSLALTLLAGRGNVSTFDRKPLPAAPAPAQPAAPAEGAAPAAPAAAAPAAPEAAKPAAPAAPAQ